MSRRLLLLCLLNLLDKRLNLEPIINSTNRARDLRLSPRAETSQSQERSDEASKKRSRSSSASEESEDEEEMSQVVRSNDSRIKRRFSGDLESN